MHSITEKFILQGTHDIKNNINQNGIARNILNQIIQFRTYPNIYEEIEAGFFPNRANYTLEKAVFHAAKGGYLDLIKQFISIHNAYSWDNNINCDSNYRRYKFSREHSKTPEECQCGNSRFFHLVFIEAILAGAVIGNHIHIIEYIDELTYKCDSIFCKVQYCMTKAINVHNLDIINYYTSKYPDLIEKMKGLFFQIAAKSGHLDLVKLYQYRPISEMGSRKYHSFEDTGYSASIEVAEYFIQNGIQTSSKYPIDMALQHAPEGYINYIKFLLSQEQLDHEYDDCLYLSAMFDRYETCKIFIDHGAANAEDVIIYAIKNNKRDIVRTLININCKNFDKYLEIDAEFNNKYLQLDILAEYLYHCEL